MDVSQQKLAEKLTILNDRGIGLLTRLYNIKKACGDAKSKPGFLSEKSLESSIKHIVKRFPNIDIRQVSNIAQYRSEINKTLQLYYYTFVDLLDFKDHVSELLTIMDACQVELDITLNYDLTKGYLDLVVTYVILMILLSRVEDRKAVLGLFHVAQEMANNPADNNFPRLGQMILEYDPPMKRLSEEFGPHSRLLVKALLSLQNIYPRRNLEADTFRKKQMLSLTAQPGYLLIPARTDTTPCEFLSLDTMERWIILGFMLCHQVSINQVKASNDSTNSSDDMWLSALRSSWVITLFRDEVLYIHTYIINFFEGIKGYGKRISEVKDACNYAIANAALMHRERRKFFRTALKEMALVMTDQPGLLGSKALYVFMGLCYARDEVVWLIRHYDNPPMPRGTTSIKIQNRNKVTEDLTDRQLPELLFHMEELRALVRKYSQVIQRYYVQYLSCYDGPALGQLLPNFIKMETEYMVLNAIYNTISSLSVKQVEENEVFDFRGLRLDWYRLQSFMSHILTRNQGLSYLMNTTTFHLKLVDFQDELLSETSDLSVLCFYNRIFEEQFHMCLEFPAQNRYIVAFPLICSHFQNCTHEMCPEERHHIRERSLSVVNMFLDEMAKEAKNIITTICDEQCTLTDKLLPKHCAVLISHHLHRKKGKDKNKKTMSEIEINKPGVESFRKTREDLTTMDKLHMALTELCFAINYCPSISVWEYTFAPKEYLHQHLENRFARALVGMVMYSAETNEIAKPSELLASVRAYMNVLQTVENYVHLDMTRVFNNVLLQQTQQQDTHGEKTVAFLYTQWYTEVLLRRVSNGNIIFSSSQRAFVNLAPDPTVPFSAEEFSDITELRALAELIGPYGMKHLNESVMFQVASQLQELKKLTATNREVLMLLRTNFDKPDIMKDLCKKLQNAENVLLRMTIIGMVLRFRQISQEALHDVLIDRIPFLLSSILDFNEHAPNGESINVAEMASAAGIPLKVDPTLVHVLQQNQKSDNREDEYQLSCLLMVFVAVSIPRLARIDASIYRASLEGHSNNIHSLATAINTVFGALFSMSGVSDVEERLKEFLALASSSLLRLGQEADKEAVKNRESVYLLLDMVGDFCLLHNSDHVDQNWGNLNGVCAKFAKKANKYVMDSLKKIYDNAKSKKCTNKKVPSNGEQDQQETSKPDQGLVGALEHLKKFKHVVGVKLPNTFQSQQKEPSLKSSDSQESVDSGSASSQATSEASTVAFIEKLDSDIDSTGNKKDQELQISTEMGTVTKPKLTETVSKRSDGKCTELVDAKSTELDEGVFKRPTLPPISRQKVVSYVNHLEEGEFGATGTPFRRTRSLQGQKDIKNQSTLNRSTLSIKKGPVPGKAGSLQDVTKPRNRNVTRPHSLTEQDLLSAYNTYIRAKQGQKDVENASAVFRSGSQERQSIVGDRNPPITIYRAPVSGTQSPVRRSRSFAREGLSNFTEPGHTTDTQQEGKENKNAALKPHVQLDVTTTDNSAAALKGCGPTGPQNQASGGRSPEGGRPNTI